MRYWALVSRNNWGKCYFSFAGIRFTVFGFRVHVKDECAQRACCYRILRALDDR